MLTTSFDLAKKAGACGSSYKHYAKHVGGITHYGKETPSPIVDVLNVLGLEDALWCLSCAVPDEQGSEATKLLRIFACDCAERVLPIYEKQCPKDTRPRQAIEVSRRFANGQATQEGLAAAEAAAWAATWAAAGAAVTRAAARAAAGAARAAAGAAEREWQAQRLRELLEAKRL